MAVTNPTILKIEVKIAIKTISEKIKNHEHKIKKEREFNLLYSLNHPNIMKAYKKWETNQSKLKFAFEYLPCKNLQELASNYKDKKMPVELVRFYAVEMIKVLNYLKHHKVLHRDIKPANIMLDHHFHIKFADFGLSVKNEENNENNGYEKLYDKFQKFKKNFENEYQIIPKLGSCASSYISIIESIAAEYNDKSSKLKDSQTIDLKSLYKNG